MWLPVARAAAVRAVAAASIATLAALASVLGAGAGMARADISPSRVLDGPANDILDVDGSALAPDGTGGVVYRKLVDGVPHVFVVPVDQGTWGSPVEVDTGDLYGASQPAVGAADGGRLLVLWVQPWAISSKGTTLYELMSASKGAGATSFGPPIVVDHNVGEPYTGDYSHVDPQVAMAPDGDAYVAYRVVDDDCEVYTVDASNADNDICPTVVGSAASPTAEVVEVRVAHFAQGPWSAMGEINRAPQLAMEVPTTSNQPSIAIGDDKAGVVAWQEPDATGVARVWARRLWGTTVGNPVELSPTTIGGQSVGADADSPSVGFDDTGLASAAFRLQGGSGSPLGTGEVMSQTVPGLESQLGPITDVGAGATIGGPNLAEGADGNVRIAYVAGGQAYVTGDSGSDPVAIGVAGGSQAFTSVDPQGGGVTAWLSAQSGLPVVDVRDDFPSGASQFGQLVGGVAGPITGLSFGSDAAGDAVAAWMQGSPGDSEVVGTTADVAPQTFTVDAPTVWQSGQTVRISWNPAQASTAVTYSILVGGRIVASGIHGPTVISASTNPTVISLPVAASGVAATITRSLSLRSLANGPHQIQIVATDASGQTLTSSTHTIKVDHTPPTVVLARVDRGRGVRITVSDTVSGVDGTATRIAFGDGTHSRGHAKATHIYRHPGLYTITARVEDKARNRQILNLNVRVR